MDALERVGANVMGTLLVGTPNAGRRQAYYYDYYSVEGLDGPGDPSKPVEAEGSFSATGPSKQTNGATLPDASAQTDEVGSAP